MVSFITYSNGVHYFGTGLLLRDCLLREKTESHKVTSHNELSATSTCGSTRNLRVVCRPFVACMLPPDRVRGERGDAGQQASRRSRSRDGGQLSREHAGGAKVRTRRRALLKYNLCFIMNTKFPTSARISLLVFFNSRYRNYISYCLFLYYSLCN